MSKDWIQRVTYFTISFTFIYSLLFLLHPLSPLFLLSPLSPLSFIFFCTKFCEIIFIHETRIGFCVHSDLTPARLKYYFPLFLVLFAKFDFFFDPPSYFVVFSQRDAKLKRIRRFWVGRRRFPYFFSSCTVKMWMLVFLITISLSLFHSVLFSYLLFSHIIFFNISIYLTFSTYVSPIILYCLASLTFSIFNDFILGMWLLSWQFNNL